MRAKPVTADEQYRLIMECRSSGLTDYQWCLEHDIKPGTFYNWVMRLRQKGYAGISSVTSNHNPARQEIVEIKMPKASTPTPEIEAVSEPIPGPASVLSGLPVIELFLSGITIRIPQDTDTDFLEQVIRTVRRASC